MEVKISTALETALEFISEVAICGEAFRKEKAELAHSFIESCKGEMAEYLIEMMEQALFSIQQVRIKANSLREKGY